MAQQFTFPQSGDADDAEHFASMIGQSNMSDFVETGLEFTYNATVPDVTVSTGKAYVSQASDIASSSGDTILRTNHVVQVPEQVVSLTTTALNYIYLEPDLGTDDNGTVSAYTTEQGGNSLLIGTIDTSTDTVTRANRAPQIDVSSILLGDDQPLSLGDDGDFEVEYNSSTDTLSIDSLTGADLLDLSKSGGLSVTGPIDVNGNTVWHSGNDGSGSGLDADTVDGLDSGQLGVDAENNGAVVVSNSSAINFNANLSVTDDGDGTVTVDGSAGTSVSNDGATVVNGATDINFGTNITAVDDGDGTSTVSVPDNWVNTTGDTMTGNLTMGGNNINTVGNLQGSSTGTSFLTNGGNFTFRDTTGLLDIMNINEGGTVTVPNGLFTASSGVKVPDNTNLTLGSGNDFAMRFDSNAIEFTLEDNNDNAYMTVSKSAGVDFPSGIDVGTLLAPADSRTEIINAEVSSSTPAGALVGYSFAINSQTVMEVRGEADGAGGSVNREIDFRQNDATNLVIENRTSDPTSPTSGQIWFRTDL